MFHKRVSIWWLNPAVIFTCIFGFTILGSVTVSEQLFTDYFAVPKYITGEYLLLAIVTCACFLAGCCMTMLILKPLAIDHRLGEKLTDHKPFLATVVNILFLFTLFGYLIWFYFMILNGIPLSLFIDVITGQPKAIFQMKEYVTKVSGITSFTNFGIPFVTVAYVYNRLMGTKKYWGWILIVTFLASLRAIFFTERIALLEIVIPLSILYVFFRLREKRKHNWLHFIPVVGVIAVITLFGVGEYFRSWLGYYEYRYDSYLEFSLMRMFGYYLTSFNTGILYLSTTGFGELPFPYYTINWMWEFPLIGEGRYSSLFYFHPSANFNNILRTLGNPEFNNPSGLFLPFHDLGLYGALVYWFLIGATTGFIYSMFTKGYLLGLFLYPIWVFGILEIPRYLYFATGRFFPIWFSLLAILLFMVWRKKVFPRPSLPAAAVASIHHSR